MNVQNSTVDEVLEQQPIQEIPDLDMARYLRSFLFQLRKHWYVLLITLLCGCLCGAFLAQNEAAERAEVVEEVVEIVQPQHTYTAHSRVYDTKKDNETEPEMIEYTISDYWNSVYLPAVHDLVIDRLDLNYTYQELDDKIALSRPTHSRMMDIAVTSEDFREAVALANAYAEAVADYAEKTLLLERPIVITTTTHIQNEPLDQAEDQAEPYTPQEKQPYTPQGKQLVSVKWAAIGLFLGAAPLFCIALLDDRIRDPRDISRNTGWDVLAVIPECSAAAGSGISSASRRSDHHAKN